MTLEIDALRRKARRAAEKFADQEWPDVNRIVLNMVTAWEDPEGYSVWEVERTNHVNHEFVRVENTSFHACLWN